MVFIPHNFAWSLKLKWVNFSLQACFFFYSMLYFSSSRYILVSCAVYCMYLYVWAPSSNLYMSELFNCGFSRVFLWETRVLALRNVRKNEGEGSWSFKSRIDAERLRLFTEKFEEYPRFQLDKGKTKTYRP